MPRPFIPLTLEQFAERLRTFQFTRPITGVHMHHTFRPRKIDYRGLPTIEAMFQFHTQTNGWSDIAQHLSIAPDGTIWTGRNWNQSPASATGFNAGAFMFETIGDFDTGKEKLEGAQRRSVVGVIALVQLKLGLPVESLHFHREFTNLKTCPGTGVAKADILAEVQQMRAQIGPAPRVIVAAPADAVGTSRGASVHSGVPSGTRSFDDTAIASLGLTPIPEDEGEVDCGPTVSRDFDGAAASRGGVSFSAEDFAQLRRHVVNLRQGKFSGGGVFETANSDVEAIFAEHLPPKLEEAKQQGKKLRIVVFAHGGLVDEESGLSMARAVIPWWIENGVYPIYFVWETGLFETITQLIKGERALGSRDFDFFDLTDRPVEELARRVGGGKIWDGMKQSAQRSVEPDGGARFVAQKLAAFCERNAGDVELHAVGHSAGSIFHSHFIPTMLTLNPRQSFTTVSFLAPAIRVQEFKTRLLPHLGSGVDALTMYTMTKDFERADKCSSLYRKSLLYLVSNAFEAERGEPILGLEESIRGDADLMAAFGIAGNPGAHSVVFSQTAATSGKSATRSKTHGGFDNDVSTMESVVRRVLNLDDAASIAAFPSDTARDFSAATVLGADTTAPAVQAEAPIEARPVAAPGRMSFGGAQPRLTRALCIGINAYPGGARLSGCVNDANDWAKTFVRLGFAKVDLITDAEATQDNLRRQIRALVNSAQSGDVIALQYAGHGTFFKDEIGVRRDEQDGNDEALVPVDFPNGKFILDDELFEMFGSLRDGASLTCFFDCCHSGSMSRGATFSFIREVQDAQGEEVKPRFIEPTPAMWEEYRRQRASARSFGATSRGLRSSEQLKAVVFSACRDDEQALERGGHGVFTTRVAPVLQTAFTAGTTNSAFQQQITKAFGASPSQNPALDCSTRAAGLPLFRFSARASQEREVSLQGQGDSSSDGVKAPFDIEVGQPAGYTTSESGAATPSE